MIINGDLAKLNHFNIIFNKYKINIIIYTKMTDYYRYFK